jgi:hypothetical protein
MRLADVLTAQLQQQNPDAVVIKPESIRLWLLTDDKAKLQASCTSIAECDQNMEIDNGSSSEAGKYFELELTFLRVDPKTEQNSGVEFPGRSLEPYVGSSFKMDDHDYNNERVIVEVGTPKFAFKFED